MPIKVNVLTTFHCSLERAFKTPMLCNLAMVHRGFLGIIPRVTHCTNDIDWGNVGAVKDVYVAPSLTQRGGFASTDKVLERIENSYWKIEVANFQHPMLGFTQLIGEWQTIPISGHTTQVKYSYTLYSGEIWLYPIQWLFAHTVWRAYMRQVLHNVEQMAINEEPYSHN